MKKQRRCKVKRLLSLAFGVTLVLGLSPAFAQSIGAGARGGLNLADIHGSEMEDVDTEMKMGFCGGGFVNLSIAGVLAIQPEVLFSMKGYQLDTEVLGETMKGSLALNYVEIPILIKVIMPVPGAIKPNIFVGPALGVKLSARTETEFGSVTVEEDVSEYVTTTDFAIVLGGGIDFWAPMGKLVLDARYTLGLTTIDEPQEGYEAVDVKNGVISVSLGYCYQH
jgi:hypothetical protein